MPAEPYSAAMLPNWRSDCCLVTKPQRVVHIVNTLSYVLSRGTNQMISKSRYQIAQQASESGMATEVVLPIVWSVTLVCARHDALGALYTTCILEWELASLAGSIRL